MVKGIQKQMVVFRTTGSAYYEEAYFVLREGRETSAEAASTMLAEANRIFDSCYVTMPGRRRKRLGRRVLFLLGVWIGMLIGCGLMGLLRVWF